MRAAAAGRESVAEHVAVADARLQTALAYIDAYYAGMALELTALNEKHAREELEAGKGRLATVSGSSAVAPPIRPRLSFQTT